MEHMLSLSAHVRLYQQSAPPKEGCVSSRTKTRKKKALFLWAVSQAGEKVRKTCDSCGERAFKSFLIVPSEMGHPSSELKCLVGWPAPETKELPTWYVFIDNRFGQGLSEMVLLWKERGGGGVMVCAPCLMGLKRWHSATSTQGRAGVWEISSWIDGLGPTDYRETWWKDVAWVGKEPI